MSDFLKMDIFFATASVALVVVTVLASIVLVYALRIMRKVDHIASLISDESELIKEDVDQLRADIRKKGMQLSTILALFTGKAKRLRKKNTTT